MGNRNTKKVDIAPGNQIEGQPNHIVTKQNQIIIQPNHKTSFHTYFGDSSSEIIESVTPYRRRSVLINNFQEKNTEQETKKLLKYLSKNKKESFQSEIKSNQLIKQLTENHLNSNEQWQSLIKHFPDGMAIINHENIIVAYNPALNIMFNELNLENINIINLIPKSIHEFEKIRIGHSIDTDSSQEIISTHIFEYKYKDIYIEITYGRLKIKRHDHYYGFLISFRDITQKYLLNQFLSRLLPAPIMARMKKGEEIKDEIHSSATIGFCDIVNFTELTLEHQYKISSIISELFTKLDEYAELLGVTKIQRIGDCCMVACGLFNENNHAERVITFMQHACKYAQEKMGLELRAGVHSGSVLSCLTYQQLPQFSLFGPNVIIASRLESHGVPNKIHISSHTLQLIDTDKFNIIRK